MPSLPPRDGVAAPPCAGIRVGASTVLTDATLNSVVRPSLPLPTMGEHDATRSSGQRRLSGSLGIASPSPLHGPQEHGGGLYTSPVLRPLVWVVGTHAHVIWGVNANIFPLPSHQHGGGNSQVSPYHQRGSTMPSAVSPAPLARAALSCRLDGWMAPSPISYGASTPSYSPRRSISSTSMGGEYFPTARPNMPSVEVTRSSHPTAIVEWAARACAVLGCQCESL